MIEELLMLVIIVSAVLAIEEEESTYAIAIFSLFSLALTLLYFLLGAAFAALFQLAASVGLIAVLFLTGEMLKTHVKKERTQKRFLARLALGVSLGGVAILLQIVIFPEVLSPTPQVLFSDAIWLLRPLEVIGQALAVLIVSLGIVFILVPEGGKQ